MLLRSSPESLLAFTSLVAFMSRLDEDLKPIRSPRAVAPLSGYFLANPEELKKAQEEVSFCIKCMLLQYEGLCIWLECCT